MNQLAGEVTTASNYTEVKAKPPVAFYARTNSFKLLPNTKVQAIRSLFS